MAGWKITEFLIGDTSSNGCFSIVRLVFRGVGYQLREKQSWSWYPQTKKPPRSFKQLSGYQLDDEPNRYITFDSLQLCAPQRGLLRILETLMFLLRPAAMSLMPRQACHRCRTWWTWRSVMLERTCKTPEKNWPPGEAGSRRRFWLCSPTKRPTTPRDTSHVFDESDESSWLGASWALEKNDANLSVWPGLMETFVESIKAGALVAASENDKPVGVVGVAELA